MTAASCITPTTSSAKPRPEVRIRSYPVTSRYGLIWIFPGDPRLAGQRGVPHLPELDGGSAWTRMDLSYDWSAHHSVVLENFNDLAHEYLHRKYQAFWDARLADHASSGDTVRTRYHVSIGNKPVVGWILRHVQLKAEVIEMTYDYPYQLTEVGDRIRFRAFFLPTSPTTTRVFIVLSCQLTSFHCGPVRFGVPRPLARALTGVSRSVLLDRVFSQDGAAVTWEQSGYEAHHDAPSLELNPSMALFQDLIIRKWADTLSRPPVRTPRNGRAPTPETDSGR
ncbi:hypothetical protein ACFQ2B_34810 [Streptomyces stramineus]